MKVTMEKVLTVQHLDIALIERTHNVPILNDVCFHLNKGEIHALVGESGSGKSMTANAIMQLLPKSMQCSTRTQIFLEEETNIAALPAVLMRQLRGKRIAMIFQEPMSALNPVMTIDAQIREALRPQVATEQFNSDETILALLASVGLSDEDYCSYYPHQLSGGMRQRVMIAIALAGSPEVLIADEPTTALDTITQKQILDLLLNLARTRKLAVLLISHDLKLIQHYATFISLMYYGELIEQALVRDFLTKPLHPYAIQLLETEPTWQKRHWYLPVIPGQVPAAGQVNEGCCFAARCRYAKPECQTVKPSWYHATKIHTVKCHLYPQYVSSITDNGSMPQAIEMPSLSNMTLLQVSNLNKTFATQVLFAIDLVVKQGECFALVGGSGSGKTTLAKIIAGLEKSDTGTISFNQQDLSLLSRQQRAQAIQLIFQDPFQSLNPKMTIFEIINEGLQFIKLTAIARKNSVIACLQEVGLSAAALDKFPHQFSGGQRQRIAIARALAMQPRILICDEPTSALDISIQAQILNLLKDLQVKHGLTILLITHNFSVVSYMADTVAVLQQGRIVEQGSTDNVLHHSQNEYTNQLIAASFLAM